MQNMLNEFYDYIAKNTIDFFQKELDQGKLHPGERYSLRLDTAEMVEKVNDALKNTTANANMQGTFAYEGVYETYTIRLSDSFEIVVAAKVNNMTDDFLTTLRNADLTIKKYPILMITYSTIDSIISGTGDMAAKGMPFHVDSIVSKLKNSIRSIELKISEKVFLDYELIRKQADRYTDKSSLFEYSDLISVLGRGYVINDDFPAFSLVPDPDMQPLTNKKKIIERIVDNHSIFEQVDRAYKYGDIKKDLEKDYDQHFINDVVAAKRKGKPWYEGYTYEKIKKSRDQVSGGHLTHHPLEIGDNAFTIFFGMELEYPFLYNVNFFIRNDGLSKSKSRSKNILIYNPDKKDKITVQIRTNISVKNDDIKLFNIDKNSLYITKSKIEFSIAPSGCTFAKAIISDHNNANIKYTLKFCIINLQASCFESIQTNYLITVPSNASKSLISFIHDTNVFVVNPRKEKNKTDNIGEGKEFDFNYDETLILTIDENLFNADIREIKFSVRTNGISVPFLIKDEAIRAIELNGEKALLLKFNNQCSFEYRNEKIIYGTTEYYAKEKFKSVLAIEDEFINNNWLCAESKPMGLTGVDINIPEPVKDAYLNFLVALKTEKSLPSLAYYSGNLLACAEKYVVSVINEINNIKNGQTLTVQQNNLTKLGCIIKNNDEPTITMTPLQPLNVLYQINLLKEKSFDDVRPNLVDKLTPLYLLPYIRDEQSRLFQAVEQNYAPEWRFYALATNKRFQGARNFVRKLVCDKIIQYIDHFKFLFEDLGNNTMCINLIDMGDCSEIFQGIIKYYIKSLQEDNISTDCLTDFIINIYNDKKGYNEFAILSDKQKLKSKLLDWFEKDVEDIGELILILTSKIKCYLRLKDESEFQYAHISFYEMASSEDSGTSPAESITTGISLGGVISGVSSVLTESWYKTGFGMKYAPLNHLTKLASLYNALYRVAFSASSFDPTLSIFTQIKSGQEGLLGKIYSSSNWVVFIDPKVDLTFFKETQEQEGENLMIIHYSDQYTSTSGYDDITVTKKSRQYNEIICDQLKKKGVTASINEINDIISLFNAVNGSWLLRLISAKKSTDMKDSLFSREKMSILSAVKLCMAYYSHPNIVWIPISLEEMLRVSGGAGLSQNNGLLSAKNLGFDKGPTSDDLLMVGIEGPLNNIRVYLHPVEVKIGQNQGNIIETAKEQVLNTYNGLWNSLWDDENKRYNLFTKLSRNYFMQVLIMSCSKMKLYNIYPDENWDWILNDFREALLNERYEFSKEMDTFIGKGTIISFKESATEKAGIMTDENICILEFPEQLGSEYMIRSAKQIEQELDDNTYLLPKRLKLKYKPNVDSVEIVHNGDIVQGKALYDIINTTAYGEVAENIEHFSDDQGKSDETSESANQFNEETNTKTVEEHIENSNSPGSMHILFGQDEGSGVGVYWEPNDTSKLFHTSTGIIGTSGTGKTQFTKSLITQLYREQRNNFDGSPLGILIFDYKGDYNESKVDFMKATNAKVLQPYHLPFNPLALNLGKINKPLLPKHTANSFKDTLCKVYPTLGVLQQNNLFACINKAYENCGIIAADKNTWTKNPPTFEDVYNIYANDENIKKTDSLASVMKKLHEFEIFESDVNKTESLFDLLNGVVVIDLNSYDTDIQNLIVAITLDLFYAQMQATGSSKLDQQFRQLTKFILVDEADNFMCEGFPSLKKILKEGREFGVGTILSTQFLEHFGSGEDDYSKYILTWVVHHVDDLKPNDIKFVFKTEPKSIAGQRLMSDIVKLQKHHSIVKIGNEEPKYIRDKAFWELCKDLGID